ncbi:translation initiation factor IF-2-like [Sorex fumeus]|uniref:translation initiation factor IF-2-like n=1 Tax=Sorex fumeus TaxID=62283 RepID=UPI0024AD1300|nr:translation initiation factor IF-2-like [Sorex fumeus]
MKETITTFGLKDAGVRRGVRRTRVAGRRWAGEPASARARPGSAREPGEGRGGGLLPAGLGRIPALGPHLWPPARSLPAGSGPPLSGFRFHFPAAVVEENESAGEQGPCGRGAGRGAQRAASGGGDRAPEPGPQPEMAAPSGLRSQKPGLPRSQKMDSLLQDT